MHTHILVREWSQHVSEPERLELLVHELGHFLGASHSPEPDSAMRPVVGNRQALRAGFQVRIDPVNSLVMAMIGEELSRRKIQRIRDLSAGSKLRLRQIYAALRPTLPDDPAADHFIALLGAPIAAQQTGDRGTTSVPTPVLLGAKQVVAQIVRSAEANRALPPKREATAGQQTRREGDELTEFYVRQAAGIARFLPDSIGPPAFLLGMGIGLDDSEVVRRHPTFGGLVRAIESDKERSQRIKVLGQPTIWNRRDLAQHFATSAYLVAASGTQASAAAGLAKELLDAKGASGFSFADLAADRAGILFAGGVVSRRFGLRSLLDGFQVVNFVPAVDDLPEGLTLAELISEFGTQEDGRFHEQLHRIDERLLELPAYRGTDSTLERLRQAGPP
jgi:hypothetical protein